MRFGLLGALALAAYYLPGAPQTYAYEAFGVACAIAIGLRVWAPGTQSRATWVVFAAGVLLWVTGDISLVFLGLANGGTAPYPSFADVLYLAAYPVLAAAIVMAGRRRGLPRDRSIALETLMLVLALALPVYVFWIRPSIEGTGLTTLEVIVTMAYPVMDLVVLAAGIRFALGTRNATPVGILLGAGLLATVGADVIYNVQVLDGTYVAPYWVDAGWLGSYVLWGSAALHPAAGPFLAPADPGRGAVLRKRAVYTAMLIFPPLSVVAAAYVSGRSPDVAAVLVATAVVAVIMIAHLRALARSGSARWRVNALLFGAGFVVVAITVALAQMQSVSQNRENETVSLLRAETELEHLSGIEADARSGEIGPGQAHRQFDSSMARIERIVGRIDADALARAGGATLEDLLADYHFLVNRELDYFATDQTELAERLDEDRVTPAFRRLSKMLDRVAVTSQRSGASTAKAVRLGTVAMLLLSALILIALFRRYGKAQRETERAKERSRTLLESERRFRAVIGGSADMITVIDRDLRVLAYAETVERFLGLDEGAMLGERLQAFLSPADAARTETALRDLAGRGGDAETLDWSLRRADGATLTAEALVINHIDDARIGGFVLNVRDVTERRRLEAELEHRAFHDHLTGLPNRALLEERLRHALTRSARRISAHAVIWLDLDDFKTVNDSLGHAVGDQLLIEVGNRLGAGLRAADTLARLGGDEFAVLLEDVGDSSEALTTARRLVDSLRPPFELAGRSVAVTGSAGVAITDGSGRGTPDEVSSRVLANADLAMYESKRVGEGTVHLFASEMHEAAAQRIEMRAEMRAGLEREEFFLLYQPIVELSTGSVKGFEALIRWRHPVSGLISPADFIPIAEQTGMIIDIGAYVLRTACRQLARWNELWPERRYVSVNVAGPQLQRDSFVDDVAAAIAETGVDACQLLLEVTETALVQDAVGNERRMSALRDLGVGLAIDDFGTGYSSLNYLRRFSVDVLKIDKSFIDNVLDGGRDRALVQAMVDMASALGLSVVAEGIEHTEQAQELAGMGCTRGQGYLFARPLMPDDAAELISAAKAPGPMGAASPLG